MDKLDWHLERLRQSHERLEDIRKRVLKCKDHPDGDCSIMYSAKNKSWIITCEEVGIAGRLHVRYNGRCGIHQHFDPSDWKKALTKTRKKPILNKSR